MAYQRTHWLHGSTTYLGQPIQVRQVGGMWEAKLHLDGKDRIKVTVDGRFDTQYDAEQAIVMGLARVLALATAEEGDQ